MDRPLTKRGKKDARSLGRLLKEKGLTPQLIISSPAKRAKMTAGKMIKQMDYLIENLVINEIVYSGTVEKMLRLIRSFNKEIDLVFIIGHNPVLLELGNYLTGSTIEKLPTSGFMLINFKTKSWKYISKNKGSMALVDKARE